MLLYSKAFEFPWNYLSEKGCIFEDCATLLTLYLLEIISIIYRILPAIVRTRI